MKFRSAIGLLTTGLFLFSSFASAAIEPPFPDVAASHKNALAIKTLKDLKIVSGDGKTGLFNPDRILNRAEFAKMIVEAKVWSTDDVSYEAVFPDLPDGQWFTKYMLKAHAMGVIKGTGTGLAAPGRQVLLTEALAMTLRAYGVAIRQPLGKEQWYDPILVMAREQFILDEATKQQIASGHIDGKILASFNAGVPRAEAAQILSNAITRFGSGFTPDILYPLSLTSSVFENEGMIPAKYTCDEGDISPPLTISSTAPGTKSFALIVDDPDAPTGTFAHWIMWNIPPDTVEISENTIPTGAIQGQTGFGEQKYGGPCPPSGENHHYYFKLYALDKTLDLPIITNKSQLEMALLLNAKILGETTLMGTYRAR